MKIFSQMFLITSISKFLRLIPFVILMALGIEEASADKSATNLRCTNVYMREIDYVKRTGWQDKGTIADIGFEISADLTTITEWGTKNSWPLEVTEEDFKWVHVVGAPDSDNSEFYRGSINRTTGSLASFYIYSNPPKFILATYATCSKVASKPGKKF